MSIISISGKMGSGKDTAGKILQWLMTDTKHKYTFEQYLNLWWSSSSAQRNNWEIKKWASSLRKVAAILLGMDEQFLYTTEFKESVLPECWNYFQKYSSANSKMQNAGVFTSWELIPMTGRDFLQKLGTDAIRNELHKQAWVNALMNEYKTHTVTKVKSYQEEPDSHKAYTNSEVLPNWIITDTRFLNELAAVKERGGITIHINRISAAASTHESEIALDNATFDYEVNNDGTIEELTEKLLPIILKFN